MKAAGVEEKLAKISGLADKTADRFSKVQTRISGFADRIKKSVKSAASEIPYLGRAFELITNPVVLYSAAVVGAITLMGNATMVAKEFNHEFLQIKQLNLDKNVEQMASYKEQIRDASFELGTNLMDSTKAFYDLQSGTGLYGQQAVDVFKKVGRYSVATGANINDSMNSTVKAVRAFGLELSNIDQLLESNAKTVQMGITSYSELAKVQTEYAGAASQAGQSVDTANKMFAALTSVGKTSDVSANLTKTFFSGLKEQAENIKKETGVEIFDNGKMRQADDILLDISRKFKTLNDEQISKIVTNIGGPEGLKAMLGKVQTGADDLIKTFEGFDNSKFNLEDALKNAQGDVTVLTDIVKNRYQVVMSKLGEKTLPLVATSLEKINTALEWAYKNWDQVGAVIKGVGVAVAAYTVIQWAMNVAMWANPIGLIVLAIAAYIGAIIYAFTVTDGFKNAIEGIGIVASELWTQFKIGMSVMASETKSYIEIQILEFKNLGQTIMAVIGNISNAWDLLKQGKFSAAKDALVAEIKTEAAAEMEIVKAQREANRKRLANELVDSGKRMMNGVHMINYDVSKIIPGLSGTEYGQQLEGKYGENGTEATGYTGNRDVNSMADFLASVAGKGDKKPDPLNLDNTDPNNEDKLTDGINTISGGGKSVRNVTVTIGKLIEELNIYAASAKEGAGEMRDVVQEELIKALQGYEIAAG